MNCRNTRPSRSAWRSPRWLKSALFGAAFALGISANAQITYTQAFNGCAAATCNSWTMSGGYSPNITSATGSGYSPCVASNPAAKSNIYSGSATTTLAPSVSLGTSNGALCTWDFNYKVIDYSSGTATGAGSVSFTCSWGTGAAGPWTTFNTFNNTSTASCIAAPAGTFTPPAGPVFVRIVAQTTSGTPDCWAVMNDLSLTQAAGSACSGTPDPGNTLASATSVCSSTAFNLSLQNSTLGSGVSYVWEYSDVSDSGPWTAFGTDAATQTGVTQPNARWYHCLVTCSGNGTTASNSVAVGLYTGTAYCGSYCVPTTSTGCTDGDVIARVILNTLDNNSGTGCPSGLLGYSNYVFNGALTTTLQAGTAYSCTVYAGQYSEGYAAWIDYNDDGVFDHPGERIGFSNPNPAGSGQVGVLGGLSVTFPVVLACNPPVGNHRMRVRAMYALAGSSVTPCANNTYGETEDYLITIDPPPPCPTASGLAASNVTNNSADLTWVLGCTETDWEVEYGATGFTPGTGTVVPVTITLATTLTGLSQNTGYDVYVRAACVPGSVYSSYFGPVAVTTLGPPACATTPSPADLGSACAASAVTLSWASVATATGYDVTLDGLPVSTNQAGTSYAAGVLAAGPHTWRVTPQNVYGSAAGCATWSFTLTGAPAGDSFGTAIPIALGGSTPGDNLAANCWTSEAFAGTNNAASADVFYTFTSGPCSPGTLTLSLCGASFDTYLHLLDAGNTAELAFNDDNGPSCTGTASSLVYGGITPNTTYVIVVEGYSSNTGTYTLSTSYTETDTDADLVPDCIDGCPTDANKIAPGICGCGVADTDTDSDGTADCNDGCPNDANKIAPGICGCGVAETGDTDGDGTADCNDGCPADANKIAPGICGCGVADTDTDLDGTADCNDGCPNDANKIAPGICGCGVADTDTDSDGTADCNDGCPNDANKVAPGICGCGVADTDTDSDGTADCNDGCPNDANKIAPGICGCGVADTDTDSDGTADCNDGCPNDANKVAPGQCGCGVADTDTDSDGLADCNDNCPNVAGQQGSACDDGNANTFFDVLDANCVCTGSVVDCNDNNPCTSDFFNGVVCVNNPLPDTDNDGTCDLIDGCPNDANKIAPGICGCGVADTDTDSDGTADCNDGCPNDANKIAPGICGCGVADTDTDLDGTADCNDGCPTDANKIAPGICGCGVADTDTDLDGTADCNDGCPNDANKVAPGICGCGVADTDTDSDGTADCNDGCPTDANKIAPGVCGCGVADTDTDSDGLADCVDNCPNVAGVQGDACDDGNPNTVGDALDANCVCVGIVPPCPDNATTLTITTDNNGGQTSWEVIPIGGGTPLCNGSGYASNSTITLNCCLPNGCYELRVLDSFGDGMSSGTTGGYVLRDGSNNRIIDNSGDGVFTTVSQITGNLGFCVPLSADGVISQHCDKLDWLTGDILQARTNSAVTAAYAPSNSTTGYQFWFFNPDGGYSRRLFQSHASPGTVSGAPANVRASYLKLSSIVTNPIPMGLMLNVRVRTQLNGVYGAFGPACLFKMPAFVCSTTQLTTTPNPVVSCGATVSRNGGILYANAVTGANKYQFNFTRPGYSRNVASTTRSLTLANWATNPLQCGLTYDVKIRISFDGGATYCPYGGICQITVSCPASVMGTQHSMEASTTTEETMPLQVWPNPNDGDQLFLSLEGIDATIETAAVDITDLFGRRVFSTTIGVDGRLNSSVALNHALASGVYVISVTTGEHVSTERIVIQ